MTCPLPPRWGAAAADAIGLHLVATLMAVLAASLVVLPQRLAQRPGAEGVLALHLDAGGTLRLWNRPVQPRELLELLQRRPGSGTPASGAGAIEAPLARPEAVLRLIPAPGVPWGIVRQAADGLQATGLPLELQLP